MTVLSLTLVQRDPVDRKVAKWAVCGLLTTSKKTEEPKGTGLHLQTFASDEITWAKVSYKQSSTNLTQIQLPQLNGVCFNGTLGPLQEIWFSGSTSQA